MIRIEGRIGVKGGFVTETVQISKVLKYNDIGNWTDEDFLPGRRKISFVE
tara:strand:- start:24 stop:173 length:150 start_codon:yes stop_codon:yes gene_type:complete